MKAKRDSRFYAPQGRTLDLRWPAFTLIELLVVIGIIAILMGVGAVFGAVITMYTAVASRTREIATLRALGFGSLPVVASVMAEAMALSLLGGAMGAGIAYLLFNGYSVSTLGGNFTQIAFNFAVTPALVIRGLALGQLGATNLQVLVWKEIRVALLNGLALGTTLGAIVWIWFGEWPLALVIASALTINLLAAALAGVMVPVTLKRLGFDPALAGGVILTTVTDVMGFLSFLGLATLILLR